MQQSAELVSPLFDANGQMRERIDSDKYVSALGKWGLWKHSIALDRPAIEFAVLQSLHLIGFAISQPPQKLQRRRWCTQPRTL